MIESYQVLSIEQGVNLNKHHHTKKKKLLIITWSAINKRYHIHMKYENFCLALRYY